MKLRIGLENFKGVFAPVQINLAMANDRLSFASVGSTLVKKIVTGGHVTSRNQGLFSDDKGGRRESLGTSW